MPAGRPPGAPNKKKGKRPIEEQDAEPPTSSEPPATRSTRAKASSQVTPRAAPPQNTAQNTAKEKPKSTTNKAKGVKKNSTRPAVHVPAAVVQVPDSSQANSDHTYNENVEEPDTQDFDEEYSSDTDLQVTREQINIVENTPTGPPSKRHRGQQQQAVISHMGYQHNSGPGEFMYQQGPMQQQYQPSFYSHYPPQALQYPQGHTPYQIQSPSSMGQQHGPHFHTGTPTPTPYHGGGTPTPTPVASGSFMQRQLSTLSTATKGSESNPHPVTSPLPNTQNTAVAVPSSYMVSRMQKPSFDIPEELFEWWRAGNESIAEFKGRSMYAMACLFMINKNISTDDRRIIFYKVFPAKWQGTDDAVADGLRFISKLQSDNMRTYRNKILDYANWYTSTEAGSNWRNLVAKHSGKDFNSKAPVPTVGQLLRWKFQDVEMVGIELTLFHLIDIFAHVLPYLVTCDTKDGHIDLVSWLLNDKILAEKLISKAAENIHFSVIHNTEESGIEVQALNQQMEGVVVVPLDQWPKIKSPGEGDMTCAELYGNGHGRKRRIFYPFAWANHAFTILGVKHVYDPGHVVKEPIRKGGIPIAEQFERWGKGIEGSPFLVVDAGPARIKTAASVPTTEIAFEPVDTDEDKRKHSQQFPSGLEFNPDERVLGSSFLNAAESKIGPGFEATMVSMVAAMDSQGHAYNAERIALAMKNLCYSASGKEGQTSQLARKWDQGTIFHKLAIMDAVVNGQRSINQEVIKRLTDQNESLTKQLNNIKAKIIEIRADIKGYENMNAKHRANLLEIEKADKEREEEQMRLMREMETAGIAEETVQKSNAGVGAGFFQSSAMEQSSGNIDSGSFKNLFDSAKF